MLHCRQCSLYSCMPLSASPCTYLAHDGSSGLDNVLLLKGTWSLIRIVATVSDGL